MMRTVALKECDDAAIEDLLDDVFGMDRKARTAYLLRQDTDWIDLLSFGVVADEMLLGSIQCWPVTLSGSQASVVLVGPVAVSPAHQNIGIGRALMKATLDAAALHGDPVMVMIGDPEYYGQFGFVAGAGDGWTLPGPWEPRRLLVRNIKLSELPESGLLAPDFSYAL
jgi:predicted N-acetyltransferase YhbS